MIKIKSGVLPKSFVILAGIANTASEMGVIVTITSGTDGQHMHGSKHYTNEAVDFRRSNLTQEQLALFLPVLRTRLGENYQVIEETDHIHVEYDPK